MQQLQPLPSNSASSGVANSAEVIEAEQQAILTQSQDAQPDSSPTGFRIFTTTFITVFLAELGDKTQLSTLLMSAESQAPWIVFAGAAAALILTSLLGVLLGQWCAKYLSPKVLETSAGISLLLIAGWLVWDVIQG